MGALLDPRQPSVGRVRGPGRPVRAAAGGQGPRAGGLARRGAGPVAPGAPGGPAARAAALLRRRGGLPFLRRGALVRAAARCGEGRAAPARRRVPVRRRGERVRQPHAHDEGGDARARRSRRRSRLRRGGGEAQRRGGAAAEAPGMDRAARVGRGERAALDGLARAVHARGRDRQGAHPRRRHLPGRAGAQDERRRVAAAVRGLPGAARHEPFALHVLPPPGRVRDRGQLPRGPGPAHRQLHRGASHRRDAAAGAGPGRGSRAGGGAAGQ